MTPETRALVTYRLERANECVEEAELLLTTGHVNTGVNRCYYACFYAVSALLLAKGLSSPKRTGIRSLFHQQVVKPGLVGISAGQLYDRLFDMRQKSDYADLVTFKADDVRVWLQEVRAFVGDIRELTLCEVEKETTT